MSAKPSVSESLERSLTTEQGGRLQYQSGADYFRLNNKRYEFSEVRGVWEDVTEFHRFGLVNRRSVFVRIELADQVFSLRQRQTDGADYYSVMSLRENLLADRKQRMMAAYLKGDTLAFPVEQTDFAITVSQTGGVQLLNSRTQQAETITQVKFKSNWLQIQTKQGTRRFAQHAIRDFALCIELPDFLALLLEQEQKFRRWYWAQSLFLYGVLINQLFKIIPAPNDYVMVLFILLTLWAIIHVYGQIAAWIFYPLIRRFNDWTAKDIK